MNEIYEQITRLSTQIAKTTNPDERERLNRDLIAASGRLPRARKAEFDVTDADPEIAFSDGRSVQVRSLYERPARSDEEREIAQGLDHAYVLGTLLKCRPDQTRYWAGLRERGFMRKAMDTSAGSGWIPTAISAELHQQVRLETKVAALFRQINMPAPIFKLPVQGNPPTAYLINEDSGPDDDLDTTKRVKASDLGIGTAQTLTARKVGVRVVPSVELTEDSIVPVLPLITEELTRAMGEARENAIVNGKRIGALDSDVTTSDDTRHWHDGLRAIATGASQGNGVAVKAVASAGTLTLADIRKVRTAMGRYAVNPSDLFWLTNTTGYNRMLGLTDANNNPLVVTRDKWGPDATLVTGAMSSLDGFGIILSQFVRDDLNRAGFYDGVTTDASMILLVNRREFVVGDYRTPTLKSRESLETDQIILVSLMRGDFAGFTPTKTAVGVLYDVR